MANDGAFGVAILEMDDEAEARRLGEGDPSVRARLNRFELYPCKCPPHAPKHRILLSKEYPAMPLEKWVGRFLIDEGERLVKTAGEMRMQYVSHQARNILLRVAAIRERRGSKGTSKEKQKALDEVIGGSAGTLST